MNAYNLVSPTAVRKLLEEMEFTPSKILGQNFLIDGNVRDAIVRSACTSEISNVVEIGPGLGVLTEALLKKSRVLAIEKDERLGHRLADRHSMPFADATILVGDALDLDLTEIMAKNKIQALVSNLPYAVGNRILVDVALSPYPLQRMVVMVQKDVADRIRSNINTKEFGLLSVFCNLNYEVDVVMDVSPNCFIPKPRIWSTVLCFNRKQQVPDPGDIDFFKKLLHCCFEQRRKQLAGVLAKRIMRSARAEAESLLSAMDLATNARPENLSVDQWVILSRKLQQLNR